MGQAGSSLVDLASDGDIQRLKAALQQRQQQHARAKDPDSSSNNDDNNNDDDDDDDDDDGQWLADVEEATHAVVSAEVHSAQQFQQLQIALELLLQANPRAWASSVANAVGWTGAHRACVTGNLSFLAFVFQRHDAHDVQERDAFGLFPVDLVPPELLRSPETMALDAAQEPRVGGSGAPIFPATARARRNLALQILRQKKREAQARCIDQFLFREHASQAKASSTPPAAAAASVDNQRVDLATSGAYFLAFEPSREHLAAPSGTGEVHERSTPLRLKYRFPRIDEFLHGYFQLIWREDEPRSEKPHYGAHVLMRDELFLDPQCVDLDDEPAAAALHVQEPEESAAKGRSVSSVRRIEEEDPVLQGCFPFDVSRLPHDAVCNVLFVASDRHLMKRTVVLSTEAIALRDAADGFDFLDPLAGSRGEQQDKSDDESGDDDESDGGFVFRVAGEAFAHPNAAFAGQAFAGLEDFEAFVKGLRRAPEAGGTQNEDVEVEAQGRQNGQQEARQEEGDAGLHLAGATA